jgi:homoserine O-acetyltransferase
MTPRARARAEVLKDEAPFALECGRSLQGLTFAYETWGRLNRRRDNAVLLFHALTGSAHAASHGTGDEPGWWESLIGAGRPLDPARYYVVCANVLGGCYGTTGPASQNPETGRPYGADFPVMTTRDMVRAQRLLLDRLGVGHLALVIGGSLGAMLTWRWLVDYPDSARAGIAIAGTPQASPWAIALNAVAREAITSDPAWRGGDYESPGPDSGLALARMIGMISYRSGRQFGERFGRQRADSCPDRRFCAENAFLVERYLKHQGEKLTQRFDARSYVLLTRAMDLHDVADRHPTLEAALAPIRARVLAVGIDSDVLFDPTEISGAVQILKRFGADAAYGAIRSAFGHDAFLVEYPQLNTLVSSFLEGRALCEF